MKRLFGFGLVLSFAMLACAGNAQESKSTKLTDESTQGLTGSPKGTPGAMNGDFNYCDDDNNLCVIGEGDCDSDAQCLGAAVCGANNGARFGFDSLWDVCVPAHCTNGQKDQTSGETDVDCGGPCGSCGLDACSNGVLDPGEEKTDCGGSCTPCEMTVNHCMNNVFDPQEGEVGVDCGGVCGRCAVLPQWCNNNMYDADKMETDLDCGGECADCPALAVMVDPGIDGATLKTLTPTFTGSAENVQTLEVFIDGQLVSQQRTGGSWSYTVSQPLGEGTHTLFVKAKSATRAVTSATISFVIEKPPVGMCPGAGMLTNRMQFSGFGIFEWLTKETFMVEEFSPLHTSPTDACFGQKALTGQAEFFAVELQKGEVFDVGFKAYNNTVERTLLWVWVTDDCSGSNVAMCQSYPASRSSSPNYFRFTAPESKTYYVAFQFEKPLIEEDGFVGAAEVVAHANIMPPNHICGTAKEVSLVAYNQNVTVESQMTDSRICGASNNYGYDGITCQQNFDTESPSDGNDTRSDVVYKVSLQKNDILDIDVNAKFKGMVWVARQCDGATMPSTDGNVGTCQAAKVFEKDVATTLSYPAPDTGEYYVIVTTDVHNKPNSCLMELTMSKRK